jgi:hypothetical protein
MSVEEVVDETPTWLLLRWNAPASSLAPSMDVG